MRTPGVSVRPIVDMTGGHHFNETFFDNVRVPKGNVVAEVNRGWYAGMTLLDFERSGVEYAAVARRALDETRTFASETKYNGKSLIDLPMVRNTISEMAVNVEVSYMLSYQIAYIQSKGEVAEQRSLHGQELRHGGRAADHADVHGHPRPVRSAHALLPPHPSARLGREQLPEERLRHDPERNIGRFSATSSRLGAWVCHGSKPPRHKTAIAAPLREHGAA